MTLPLDQSIQRFISNDERMNTFANGSASETYTTNTGAVVPSIQKFLSDKSAEIDAELSLSSPQPIGNVTPNTGTFTTLASTGNTTLGNSSTDTVTVNGYIGVGVPSVGAIAGLSNNLGIETPNGAAGLALVRNTANTQPGNLLFGKSRSAIAGGFTTVIAGDGLGNIIFNGADGNAYSQSALISAVVDGTPGTGSVPGRLVFSTSSAGSGTPTERLRIDSAGNLGLGVVPSAWRGNERALQVMSASLSYINTSAKLSNNVYYNGADTPIYIGTLPASMAVQRDGSHQWYSAPSGTAGNTITFTQVLSVEKDKSLALQGATSQTGTGISFPATQVASSDANTLDDYEEGTFTPTIVGTTTAGTGTYILQVGRYTKIGNRVHFTLKVTISAHTGTGNMSIGGLPFTSNATAGNQHVCEILSDNLTFTGSTPQGLIQPSSASVVLLQQVSGAALSATAMDVACTIYATAAYEV
jgi:hypothetical protein